MSIGTITVDLLARTGSFDTDLNRSAKLAERRAKEIDASFAKLGAVVGAGLALVGAGALTMANTAIDQLAALDDAAQKTGSSVENLSRIQQTALAFNQDFGEIDSALSRLARNIAGFGAEADKTNDALSQLGIAARDLNGNLRDPSELLIEVAKRLQEFEDGAEKAQVATDLFGRAGADLIPFLNDMAENVDRFTGVSREAAAEAATFQDNLSKLRVNADQLSQTIVSSLLPSVNSLVTEMNASTKASGGLLAGLKNLFEFRVAGAFGMDGVGQIEALNKALDQARKNADSNRAKGLMASLRVDEQTIANLERQIEAVRALQRINDERGADAIAAATGGWVDLPGTRIQPPRKTEVASAASPKGGKEVESQAERYLKTLESQLITVQDLTVAEEAQAKIRAGQLGLVTEDMRNQILAAATLVDLTRDQVKAEQEKQAILTDGRRVFEETRTPAEKLNAEYTRLNDLLAAGAIDWDTYARATFAAQDNFDKLTAKTEAASDQMNVFAENAARGIQSSLADFLFDPFDEGLDGMVKGFAKTLQRIAAEIAASEIAKALFGSAVNGGSGSGWIGTAFSAIGNLFGGTFADGGSPPVGKISLVGERGPELFVPSTAGTIIPNHMLGSGGAKVNVNVYNAPEGTEVRQSESDDGTINIDIIHRLVDERINRQLRPGGSINSAFKGAR